MPACHVVLRRPLSDDSVTLASGYATYRGAHRAILKHNAISPDHEIIVPAALMPMKFPRIDVPEDKPSISIPT